MFEVWAIITFLATSRLAAHMAQPNRLQGTLGFFAAKDARKTSYSGTISI
jgi:hypothetical protein